MRAELLDADVGRVAEVTGCDIGLLDDGFKTLAVAGGLEHVEVGLPTGRIRSGRRGAVLGRIDEVAAHGQQIARTVARRQACNVAHVIGVAIVVCSPSLVVGVPLAIGGLDELAHSGGDRFVLYRLRG
jgi:hypothetical protein